MTNNKDTFYDYDVELTVTIGDRNYVLHCGNSAAIDKNGSANLELNFGGRDHPSGLLQVKGIAKIKQHEKSISMQPFPFNVIVDQIAPVREKPLKSGISVRNYDIHIRHSIDAMSNGQFAANYTMIKKLIAEKLNKKEDKLDLIYKLEGFEYDPTPTIHMYIDSATGKISPRTISLLNTLMDAREHGLRLVTHASGTLEDCGVIFALSGAPSYRDADINAIYKLNYDCTDMLQKSGFKLSANNPVSKLSSNKKLGHLISSREAMVYGLTDKIAEKTK